MFKRTASRSRKFKIYARSAGAGGREAEMGLENDRKISSHEVTKFNTRRKAPLCRIKNLRGRANLNFRRKFKIYSAQNSPLRDF